MIILNPVFERFHPEYHVAYKRFFDEVLPVTTDPFEMQDLFQEKFAADPELRELTETVGPTTVSILSPYGTGPPIRCSTYPK